MADSWQPGALSALLDDAEEVECEGDLLFSVAAEAQQLLDEVPSPPQAQPAQLVLPPAAARASTSPRHVADARTPSSPAAAHDFWQLAARDAHALYVATAWRGAAATRHGADSSVDRTALACALTSAGLLDGLCTRDAAAAIEEEAGRADVCGCFDADDVAALSATLASLRAARGFKALEAAHVPPQHRPPDGPLVALHGALCARDGGACAADTHEVGDAGAAQLCAAAFVALCDAALLLESEDLTVTVRSERCAPSVQFSSAVHTSLTRIDDVRSLARRAALCCSPRRGAMRAAWACASSCSRWRSSPPRWRCLLTLSPARCLT
jgi:hypothetical protein